MGRCAVPPGKIVKGWIIRLAPTPEQVAQFRRDDGARRFASNWAVMEMRRSFDDGNETGQYDPAIWSFYDLRKRWNSVKSEVAPWWAECSIPAMSSFLA